MLAALSHDRHSPLTAMRLRIEILEETEDSIRLKALIRRHALNRALRNLINKAAGDGGAAEVTVTQEPGFAVITLAGKGPGLPEDQLEAVFEPFVRLEACRSRDTGGASVWVWPSPGRSFRRIAAPSNCPTGLAAGQTPSFVRRLAGPDQMGFADSLRRYHSTSKGTTIHCATGAKPVPISGSRGMDEPYAQRAVTSVL